MSYVFWFLFVPYAVTAVFAFVRQCVLTVREFDELTVLDAVDCLINGLLWGPRVLAIVIAEYGDYALWSRK